jgi:hypothetical protein
MEGNMSDAIDKEIGAIKKLLVVLEPLNSQVRESVLGYVLKRLNIKLPADSQIQTVPPITTPLQSTEFQLPKIQVKKEPIHLRDLKEEKKPQSAIEMAVLVAYYLSHVVTGTEHKDVITPKDIETYFKIADFQLPKKSAFTLPNTKKAGYLDSIGKGKYKLNPVGYNLIAHNLPRTGKSLKTQPRRKKASKRQSLRKPVKK